MYDVKFDSWFYNNKGYVADGPGYLDRKYYLTTEEFNEISEKLQQAKGPNIRDFHLEVRDIDEGFVYGGGP